MIMLDLLLTSDSLLQTLENIDRQALLAVNGSDSLYLDRVAHVLTTAITWLPLYISLFYVVLKNNDTVRYYSLSGVQDFACSLPAVSTI